LMTVPLACVSKISNMLVSFSTGFLRKGDPRRAD